MSGEVVGLGQPLGRRPVAVDDVARAVHGSRGARLVARGTCSDRDVRRRTHCRDRELADDHRVVHLGQPVEAVRAIARADAGSPSQ